MDQILLVTLHGWEQKSFSWNIEVISEPAVGVKEVFHPLL